MTQEAMKKIIQVRVTQGNRYFVAECLDLPVVTQAKTLDASMENVREAIGLALEDENPAIFDLEQDAAILASFELPFQALNNT
jgi:predicted RNase H-like HicB family nuclease